MTAPHRRGVTEPGTASVVPVAARRAVAPRWTDTRLLLGVLLVLGSVVVGTRVVASAQQTRPVWATSRDLPAGVTLREDDLVLAQVRLDDASARYVGAGSSVAGRSLTRPVAAGELLPRSALDAGAARSPGHLLSLPVQTAHYPPGLGRGDVVDVYVTARDLSATAQDAGSTGSARRVLSGATVVDTEDASAGLRDPAATVAIVLEVPDGDVPDLVGALRSGDVDLVLVGSP